MTTLNFSYDIDEELFFRAALAAHDNGISFQHFLERAIVHYLFLDDTEPVVTQPPDGEDAETDPLGNKSDWVSQEDVVQQVAKEAVKEEAKKIMEEVDQAVAHNETTYLVREPNGARVKEAISQLENGQGQTHYAIDVDLPVPDRTPVQEPVDDQSYEEWLDSLKDDTSWKPQPDPPALGQPRVLKEGDLSSTERLRLAALLHSGIDWSVPVGYSEDVDEARGLYQKLTKDFDPDSSVTNAMWKRASLYIDRVTSIQAPLMGI